MDHHETIGGKPIDHLIDHPLATKKDRPLFGFERPQAGIGIFRPGRAEKIRTRRRLVAHNAAAGFSRAWLSQLWN